MKKTWFFEYRDRWDTFERTSIKAESYEEAWFRIKVYVGSGATILKVFEPVFEGEYLVE